MSDSGYPLPPPTFEFLVFSLKTQAEMQLGLLSFGEEKLEKPNLAGARHAIDLLAMIAEKTHGNLALEGAWVWRWCRRNWKTWPSRTWSQINMPGLLVKWKRSGANGNPI